jgi:hypothetical protein
LKRKNRGTACPPVLLLSPAWDCTIAPNDWVLAAADKGDVSEVWDSIESKTHLKPLSDSGDNDMNFEVVGEITGIEIIAVGSSIR